MKYLCAIHLLVISFSVNAQMQIIDSMKQALIGIKDDTARAQNMIDISEKSIESEPDTAMIYAHEALAIAQQINDKKKEAVCLNIIGRLLINIEDYSAAQEKISASLKISEEFNYEKDMASSYINLGLISENLKDYEHAYREYIKAKTILQKIIREIESVTIRTRGQVNAELSRIKTNLSTTLLNIGNIYEAWGKLDSAMEFQKHAKILAEQAPDSVNIYYSLMNIAGLYLKQGNTDLALSRYKESVRFLLEINDKRALSFANHGLAEVYEKKGQTDSAIHYAMRALYYAAEDEYKNERYNADTLLIKLYKILKNKDSALHYSELSAATMASMNIERQSREVQNQKSKDAFFRQEIKNQKANDERDHKIRTAKQKLYILLLFTLLILSTAIIIFRYYKSTKRSKDKIEILQRELHHRVKNNLAVISSLVEVAAKETASNLPLTELENQISSMAFVHDQLTGENDITQLQMQPFLEKLMEHVNHSMAEGNSIRYQIDAPVLIPANKATPLALIINELATNSIKYAFAKKENKNIQIKMSQLNGHYSLLYNDNGTGRAENSESGYGSQLIKGLSSQLKGKMRLWNDNGYNFELIIPT